MRYIVLFLSVLFSSVALSFTATQANAQNAPVIENVKRLDTIERDTNGDTLAFTFDVTDADGNLDQSTITAEDFDLGILNRSGSTNRYTPAGGIERVRARNLLGVLSAGTTTTGGFSYTITFTVAAPTNQSFRGVTLVTDVDDFEICDTTTGTPLCVAEPNVGTDDSGSFNGAADAEIFQNNAVANANVARATSANQFVTDGTDLVWTITYDNIPNNELLKSSVTANDFAVLREDGRPYTTGDAALSLAVTFKNSSETNQLFVRDNEVTITATLPDNTFDDPTPFIIGPSATYEVTSQFGTNASTFLRSSTNDANAATTVGAAVQGDVLFSGSYASDVRFDVANMGTVAPIITNIARHETNRYINTETMTYRFDIIDLDGDLDESTIAIEDFVLRRLNNNSFSRVNDTIAPDSISHTDITQGGTTYGRQYTIVFTRDVSDQAGGINNVTLAPVPDTPADGATPAVVNFEITDDADNAITLDRGSSIPDNWFVNNENTRVSQNNAALVGNVTTRLHSVVEFGDRALRWRITYNGRLDPDNLPTVSDFALYDENGVRHTGDNTLELMDPVLSTDLSTPSNHATTHIDIEVPIVDNTFYDTNFILAPSSTYDVVSGYGTATSTSFTSDNDAANTATTPTAANDPTIFSGTYATDVQFEVSNFEGTNRSRCLTTQLGTGAFRIVDICRVQRHAGIEAREFVLVTDSEIPYPTTDPVELQWIVQFSRNVSPFTQGYFGLEGITASDGSAIVPTYTGLAVGDIPATSNALGTNLVLVTATIPPNPIVTSADTDRAFRLSIENTVGTIILLDGTTTADTIDPADVAPAEHQYTTPALTTPIPKIVPTGDCETTNLDATINFRITNICRVDAALARIDADTPRTPPITLRWLVQLSSNFTSTASDDLFTLNGASGPLTYSKVDSAGDTSLVTGTEATNLILVTATIGNLTFTRPAADIYIEPNPTVFADNISDASDNTIPLSIFHNVANSAFQYVIADLTVPIIANVERVSPARTFSDELYFRFDILAPTNDPIDTSTVQTADFGLTGISENFTPGFGLSQTRVLRDLDADDITFPTTDIDGNTITNPTTIPNGVRYLIRFEFDAPTSTNVIRNVLGSAPPASGTDPTTSPFAISTTGGVAIAKPDDFLFSNTAETRVEQNAHRLPVDAFDRVGTNADITDGTDIQWTLTYDRIVSNSIREAVGYIDPASVTPSDFQLCGTDGTTPLTATQLPNGVLTLYTSVPDDSLVVTITADNALDNGLNLQNISLCPTSTFEITTLGFGTTVMPFVASAANADAALIYNIDNTATTPPSISPSLNSNEITVSDFFRSDPNGDANPTGANFTIRFANTIDNITLGQNEFRLTAVDSQANLFDTNITISNSGSGAFLNNIGITGAHGSAAGVINQLYALSLFGTKSSTHTLRLELPSNPQAGITARQIGSEIYFALGTATLPATDTPVSLSFARVDTSNVESHVGSHIRMRVTYPDTLTGADAPNENDFAILTEFDASTGIPHVPNSTTDAVPAGTGMASRDIIYAQRGRLGSNTTYTPTLTIAARASGRAFSISPSSQGSISITGLTQEIQTTLTRSDDTGLANTSGDHIRLTVFYPTGLTGNNIPSANDFVFTNPTPSSLTAATVTPTITAPSGMASVSFAYPHSNTQGTYNLVLSTAGQNKYSLSSDSELDFGLLNPFDVNEAQTKVWHFPNVDIAKAFVAFDQPIEVTSLASTSFTITRNGTAIPSSDISVDPNSTSTLGIFDINNHGIQNNTTVYTWVISHPAGSSTITPTDSTREFVWTTTSETNMVIESTTISDVFQSRVSPNDLLNADDDILLTNTATATWTIDIASGSPRDPFDTDFLEYLETTNNVNTTGDPANDSVPLSYGRGGDFGTASSANIDAALTVANTPENISIGLRARRSHPGSAYPVLQYSRAFRSILLIEGEELPANDDGVTNQNIRYNVTVDPGAIVKELDTVALTNITSNTVAQAVITYDSTGATGIKDTDIGPEDFQITRVRRSSLVLTEVSRTGAAGARVLTMTVPHDATNDTIRIELSEQGKEKFVFGTGAGVTRSFTIGTAPQTGNTSGITGISSTPNDANGTIVWNISMTGGVSIASIDTSDFTVSNATIAPETTTAERDKGSTGGVRFTVLGFGPSTNRRFEVISVVVTSTSTATANGIPVDSVLSVDTTDWTTTSSGITSPANSGPLRGISIEDLTATILLTPPTTPPAEQAAIVDSFTRSSPERSRIGQSTGGADNLTWRLTFNSAINMGTVTNADFATNSVRTRSITVTKSGQVATITAASLSSTNPRGGDDTDNLVLSFATGADIQTTADTSTNQAANLQGLQIVGTASPPAAHYILDDTPPEFILNRILSDSERANGDLVSSQAQAGVLRWRYNFEEPVYLANKAGITISGDLTGIDNSEITILPDTLSATTASNYMIVSIDTNDGILASTNANFTVNLNVTDAVFRDGEASDTLALGPTSRPSSSFQIPKGPDITPDQLFVTGSNFTATFNYTADLVTSPLQSHFVATSTPTGSSTASPAVITSVFNNVLARTITIQGTHGFTNTLVDTGTIAITIDPSASAFFTLASPKTLTLPTSRITLSPPSGATSIFTEAPTKVTVKLSYTSVPPTVVPTALTASAFEVKPADDPTAASLTINNFSATPAAAGSTVSNVTFTFDHGINPTTQGASFRLSLSTAGNANFELDSGGTYVANVGTVLVPIDILNITSTGGSAITTTDLEWEVHVSAAITTANVGDFQVTNAHSVEITPLASPDHGWTVTATSTATAGGPNQPSILNLVTANWAGSTGALNQDTYLEFAEAERTIMVTVAPASGTGAVSLSVQRAQPFSRVTSGAIENIVSWNLSFSEPVTNVTTGLNSQLFARFTLPDNTSQLLFVDVQALMGDTTGQHYVATIGANNAAIEALRTASGDPIVDIDLYAAAGARSIVSTIPSTPARNFNFATTDPDEILLTNSISRYTASSESNARIISIEHRNGANVLDPILSWTITFSAAMDHSTILDSDFEITNASERRVLRLSPSTIRVTARSGARLNEAAVTSELTFNTNDATPWRGAGTGVSFIHASAVANSVTVTNRTEILATITGEARSTVRALQWRVTFTARVNPDSVLNNPSFAVTNATLGTIEFDDTTTVPNTELLVNATSTANVGDAPQPVVLSYIPEGTALWTTPIDGITVTAPTDTFTTTVELQAGIDTIAHRGGNMVANANLSWTITFNTDMNDTTIVEANFAISNSSNLAITQTPRTVTITATSTATRAQSTPTTSVLTITDAANWRTVSGGSLNLTNLNDGTFTAELSTQVHLVTRVTSITNNTTNGAALREPALQWTITFSDPMDESLIVIGNFTVSNSTALAITQTPTTVTITATSTASDDNPVLRSVLDITHTNWTAEGGGLFNGDNLDDTTFEAILTISVDLSGYPDDRQTAITDRPLNDREVMIQEMTEERIYNFVSSRATQIISTAPNLVSRSTTPVRSRSRTRAARARSGSGPIYSITSTQGNSSMSFAKQGDGTNLEMDYDSDSSGEKLNFLGDLLLGTDATIWMELKYSKTENDTTNSEGESLHFNYGYDYTLNDKSILGILIQYDQTTSEQKNTDPITGDPVTSKLDGEGVLLGPYIVTNLTDNLTFDAHVAYGLSKNEISPVLGVNPYTDEFDTTRFVASGKLSGILDFGTYGWTMRPQLSYTYYDEHQASYFDFSGIPISSRDLETTRVTFGPTFTTDIAVEDSILSPSFGFSGVYTDTDFEQQTFGSDLSLRVDSGVLFTGHDGVDINLSGYYDGIGIDSNTYGLSVLFSIDY